MTMLLTILKIIGIVLLVVLLTILVMLLFVLFVPIRYETRGNRRMEDDVPARIAVRAHWLLHIINVSFRYPEAAYVRVRIFCFTVFSTRPESEAEKEKKETVQDAAQHTGQSTDITGEKKHDMPHDMPQEISPEEQVEDAPVKFTEEKTEKNSVESPGEEDAEEEGSPKFLQFLRKLFKILKNIQYTIQKICDKIKHIIKNIRYYINVIQSEHFRSAWGVCSDEVLGLLQSICPRKLEGSFTVGTGDPASTAQILAIHGMLYPLIGEHITVIPDFERFVIEGQFLIKGRITLFRFLKTAGKLYFHKDLRKVIRLLKKGGSTNGRQ